MFERFTDPITVVRTVLARDVQKLQKLIAGGARIDRRTTYDPWMTPLDAACSTKQVELVTTLLATGAPIFGSSIYEAIKVDFADALLAMHRRGPSFHQRFQQEAGNLHNPRLNRWLSGFTALDLALSLHARECSFFLESINARKHQHISAHLSSCSAVFIEDESFISIGNVNTDGLAEVTSGYYCAKCERFVKVAR